VRAFCFAGGATQLSDVNYARRCVALIIAIVLHMRAHLMSTLHACMLNALLLSSQTLHTLFDIDYIDKGMYSDIQEE
jgi:hypothetical protein